MKLNLKEDTELIINNENLISIVTKPNTNSKIILFNPKIIKLKMGNNSKLSLYTFYKDLKIKKEATLEKDSRLECFEIILNTSIESNINLNETNSSYLNKSLSFSTKDLTSSIDILDSFNLVFISFEKPKPLAFLCKNLE